jgi:NAD(P)-dependent dehydrogenase (short-subunit alcohol dehydrogenase family)
MSAYKRSKLANILFTFELARRLSGTNVTANCVSPGAAKTRFGDNMTGVVGVAPRIMKRLPIFKTPDKAARAIVELASAPELEGVSGRFFLRGKDKPTEKLTHDVDIAAELWDVSECLTAHAYLPD